MSQSASPEAASRSTGAPAGVLRALLPVMVVLFVAYLIVGIAMPVLPLHVSQGLGQSAFVVGLVASTQYAMALFSRLWAGVLADRHGAKLVMQAGLAAVIAGGGIYLFSLWFIESPSVSVGVLLAGRALLGVAQSFIVMGSMSWGLALAGPDHAGKVMAWMGISLYLAFAIGAPAGTMLYDAYGFAGVALATMLAPAATMLLVAPLTAPGGTAQKRASFMQVMHVVWWPGLGLMLSVVGFGAVATFIALLWVERGWDNVWLAFTVSSLAFVAARVTLGHVPDRIGGAKIAMVFVLLEGLGQVLIWLAPAAWVALLGIAFTGFGYALVYPGLGVEAMRRSPPQSRGLAMGAFTAFYDLSLALMGPALGYFAGVAGLSSVFLLAAIAAVAGAAIAASMAWKPVRG